MPRFGLEVGLLGVDVCFLLGDVGDDLSLSFLDYFKFASFFYVETHL